jgi:hypothetical protein
MTKKLTATCGHHDPLGYFTVLPCHKCTVKAHRKATHPSTPTPRTTTPTDKVKP